ncbi:DUF5018 domain-containing protein, partial [Maribacter sp.]|nr:DUF5018 domain-containing protein [Maribacter sp.]
MKNKFKFLGLVTILLFIASCSKSDDTTVVKPIEETLKSNAKQLSSFVLEIDDNAFLTEPITATVNEDTKTIRALVPSGTDISAIVPTVQVSDKATIDPRGAQDFNTAVTYTVTAEDGSKSSYNATIVIAPETANAILSFQFLLSENPFEVNIIAEIDEETKLITFNIPDGADIGALLPTIQTSNGASISPQGAQNFEETVTYTVTAQDGSTTTYQVKGKLSQKAILLAIYNESPDNSLDWDIESNAIGDWSGVTVDADGKVIELYLGDGNIRNLSPKIGLLTHLTRLSIGKSHFTELPPEIGNLINLTALNIDLSSITTLPDEIGNLTNLTSLSIRRSSLNKLPVQIGNLINLNVLILASNELEEIPTEIGNLINLTDLDLRSNQLAEIPAQLFNL